jgi:hypothetical protein
LAQAQPSAEQLAQIKQLKNQQFMSLSHEQFTKMNADSGTTAFQGGRNLNFSSPTISGSYATGILIKHNLNVNTVKGTGTIVPNAGYPYNFVQNLTVSLGNRQISVRPYIFGKVNPMIEGYARTLADDAILEKKSSIDNLLHKVPTDFSTDGDHTVTVSVFVPFNSLHPASVNGCLPIFSSNTRVQAVLNLSTVVGKDPLDNVFATTGNAAVTVTGTVDITMVYRSYESLSTASQALEMDLSGLPTVQVLQLGTVTSMSPNIWLNQSFSNPYRFAKIFHLVVDAKQSDKLAAADNITGFRYTKAENANSILFQYGSEQGANGLADYYYSIREKFGVDLPEGVVLGLDATTANLSNVSSKMGANYFNNDGARGGYSSAQFGFKLASIGDPAVTGIAPRIETYGIILNEEGIKAL